MQNQSLGKLNIIAAVWGLKTVTEEVNNLINKGIPETLEFKVNNKTIGEDGWLGQIKSISILYNYDGGDLQVAVAKEGEILSINPDKVNTSLVPAFDTIRNDNLSILAATYGPADVTSEVKHLISAYNTLSFKIDNTTFNDSWYGIAKTFIIFLGSGNELSAIEVFVERENCYIDLNDVIPAL